MLQYDEIINRVYYCGGNSRSIHDILDHDVDSGKFLLIYLLFPVKAEDKDAISNKTISIKTRFSSHHL